MGRATSSKAKPADWFDTIVDEYDSYGRRLQPDQLAAAQAVGWAKVEKTAQIACAAPGCEAAASVTMFNGEYEQAKNCKFTFKVHATDFDDDFSDERVEYVKINGGIVNSMCNPGTSGCNATAGVALYPCVTDVDLTQIIATNNGTLAISAKISKMVDECPFEGFMLNGIATTTCYVTGKKSALPTTPPPLVAVPSPSLNLLGTHAQCALQCGAPNCTASCTILLDATAIIGSTCKMTIVVNNTDFDGELGSLEVIELISVDGKEISVDASPGKNPCKAEQEGHPLPPDELSYSPMQEQDVTAYAMGGSMTVAAKISEMVDECPSNGFLLDGMAYVVCT